MRYPLTEFDDIQETAAGFQSRDMRRFLCVHVIITLALFPFISLFLDDPTPETYVYTILASKLIIFGYLFWLIRHRGWPWHDLGADTLGQWWAWPVAFASYGVLYPLMLWLDSWNKVLLSYVYGLFGIIFIPRPQEVTLLIFGGVLDTAARILLVTFTVFLGPLAEELAFRGVGTDGYRRVYGLAGTLVWTSVWFGIYHLSVQYLIPLSIMGAVFGVARLLSRSLWCAVALHCFHNFFTLAVMADSLDIITLPRPW